MNEKELNSELKNIYANDKDVPHSLVFLENDSCDCFSDPSVDHLSSQINTEQLHSDIKQGAHSLVSRCKDDKNEEEIKSELNFSDYNDDE